MMKKMMMLSAVAALMLAGSAMAAGPDDPTVQIKAPEASYKLYKGDFDDFAHHYALSNDKYIRFTQSGRHYWARLKNEERVELYPIAANVFLTAAGTRVEFRDQGEQVVIDNFERLPMAVAMTATNVRVVASR
jgi:opacity protein-like surface antigen